MGREGRRREGSKRKGRRKKGTEIEGAGKKVMLKLLLRRVTALTRIGL